MKSIFLCSSIFLLCQVARGLQLPFAEHFHFDDTLYPSTQKVSEEPDTLNSSWAEEHRTENGSLREETLNSSESTATDDGHSSTISPDIATSTRADESRNLTQHEDASNVTGNDAADEEKVARGKPSTTESSATTPQPPQSLYQKTWTLISDTYTLSILVPVAAGVVFATSVLLTIAFCRCLKRCCLRRRLRKKVLPDSVKNLRPSDRARLLAESSDDEF